MSIQQYSMTGFLAVSGCSTLSRAACSAVMMEWKTPCGTVGSQLPAIHQDSKPKALFVAGCFGFLSAKLWPFSGKQGAGQQSAESHSLH
jgi:hypothetical protein